MLVARNRLQRMATNWRKFFALPVSHSVLLVAASLLLPFAGLLLWLLGFKRCYSLLTRTASSRRRHMDGQPEASMQKALSSGRMVQLAADHGPYRALCLTRSMVLWWLLERQGITSALRIGALKEAGELKAHAWVETMGVALNESDHPGKVFTPLTESA